MNSTFSYKIFLYPILIIAICIFALSGIIISILLGHLPLTLNHIINISLLILLLSWIFLGDLRKRMTSVAVQDDALIIRRFIGVGKATNYNYMDLDGYKIFNMSSRGSDIEFLYFYQNGKVVGQISAYYHSNYEHLKNHLTGKLHLLGAGSISFRQEIKEIVSNS